MLRRKSLWGFKDPRTALTLPFWREVVAQMRYVICVRDPAEVALSLAHYRGHDGLAARANALWLESTARSLVETNGHGRLLVTYDSWFDEPEREALRLAEFVGRPLGPDVLAAIHDFVDADLRHHGADSRAVAAAGRQPADVGELYAVLRDSHSGEGEPLASAERLAEKVLQVRATARRRRPRFWPPPSKPVRVRLPDDLVDEGIRSR